MASQNNTVMARLSLPNGPLATPLPDGGLCFLRSSAVILNVSDIDRYGETFVVDLADTPPEGEAFYFSRSLLVTFPKYSFSEICQV